MTALHGQFAFVGATNVNPQEDFPVPFQQS
jgi:hypothetical protein